MSYVPCGCDGLTDAAKEPTPDGAAAKRAIAEQNQRTWRCPRAGGPDPDRTTEPLSPECVEVLEALERVTSLPTTRAQTCPGYYCMTPLSKATRLWRHRSEKRGVRLGSMPAGIVPCVEALDAAIDARTAHDHEQHRARMKRAEDERNRGGQ